MSDQLQDGIYFRPEERPAPCYRLLLLNAAAGATAAGVHHAMAATMEMLHRLPDGEVRELRGQPDRDAELTREVFKDFESLLGFGRPLFDEARHRPTLTTRPLPDFLTYLSGDRVSPELPWASGEVRNCGEADLALQLTGHSEAAVNRAAVEVWKLIVDEGLPLEVFASFAGFQRGDGRGWLEFHDGVSNIQSTHRLEALEALPDPSWMAGGTYMAFLRFSIDLAAWRALDRVEQELVIGRDKLTGGPLVATERDTAGRIVPVAAPPRTEDSGDAEVEDYNDPAQTTDPLIEASHTHRANQNRSSPFAPAGLRIFRQGYDFLEGFSVEGPRLGLNFVSFQADLGTLQHVLHLPGWLGDVNFGGPSTPKPGDPPSPALIELLAGGLYAVPPVADPFPGAELFDPKANDRSPDRLAPELGGV